MIEIISHIFAVVVAIILFIISVLLLLLFNLAQKEREK